MIYKQTDQEVLQELGRRLKVHRLQRNLSAADLAERAGVSRLTVVKAEAGKNPTLSTLIRILRALGQLDALDGFLAAPTVSPLALLDQTTPRVRTRAYRRKVPRPNHG